MSHRFLSLAFALTLACGLPGCGSKSETEVAATCDEICQDSIAVRSVRETIKLVYNLTIQGKPVGPQDLTTPCPLGGSAHLTGTATSNAEQGSTEVDLQIEFKACAYRQRDNEALQNYDVVLNGTVTEKGILAVQPTATTALILTSEALSISGNVFDPPVSYNADACAMKLAQSGPVVSGVFCGRKSGFTF